LACAAENAARSCCGSAVRCCCGGESRTPLQRPGTASVKTSPEQAADLAFAPAIAATAGALPPDAPSAVPSTSAAGPIYLSNCSFRC